MLDANATLSDHILVAVLSLLKKEVSEHGRHLPQYFHLFFMYANLGTPQVSLLDVTRMAGLGSDVHADQKKTSVLYFITQKF